jgi:hypothetical protein
MALVAAAQRANGEPFSMTPGPKRVAGSFHLTHQHQADELIERITQKAS